MQKQLIVELGLYTEFFLFDEKKNQDEKQKGHLSRDIISTAGKSLSWMFLFLLFLNRKCYQSNSTK